MIILGIDPGYEKVGFAVINSLDNGRNLTLIEYGTIKTGRNLPFYKRIQSISQDIKLLIKRTKPEAAAVEELFFNTNQKTAIMVGQARGAILLTLADAGLPVHEYTPLEVKIALTGYGRAEKSQVQAMVKTLLKLDKKAIPDDAADAVATAICCGVSIRL